MTRHLVAPNLVGKCFVWEPLQPHARSLCVVSQVIWNGEDWWVESISLETRKVSRNEYGRFMEAVTLNPTQVGELYDD